METKFVLTVAGHPRRIREYRDALRDEHPSVGGGGDFGDVIFGLLFELFVAPGLRSLKRSWQGRNDPPIEQGRFAGLNGVRAIVNWSYVSTNAAGEPLGTVTIDMYSKGQPVTGPAHHWPTQSCGPSRRPTPLSMTTFS
jgi:hypothetical protein